MPNWLGREARPYCASLTVYNRDLTLVVPVARLGLARFRVKDTRGVQGPRVYHSAIRAKGPLRPDLNQTGET